MPLDPSLLLCYGDEERLRTLLSLRGQSLRSDDSDRLDAGLELYTLRWRSFRYYPPKNCDDTDVVLLRLSLHHEEERSTFTFPGEHHEPCA